MSTPAKIGRYEILEELGRGAMGSVYKARDPMMDRTVAVKTILASALAGASANEYRERFFREARAAGRFSHPGIVTVHDVGEHEGTPYLVMEYITGRTLAQTLESGERFGFERIYEIGRDIAEALGYAHAHGVIHRDIKPANIMLAAPLSGGLAPSQRGAAERAKVTDFGVAKLTAAQVTVTGQLLGTPSFMPPEQFTGAPVDGRSDLFSLGVILYWMATGDKPFTGDTITAVSYKIVHTDIVPPRKINPAIPAAFEQVLLKLLQKDPALRYASGEALAADLAALREGRTPSVAEDTVITRPPSAAASGFNSEVTQDIPSSARSVRSAPGHKWAQTLPDAPAHVSTVAQPPPAAAHSRWQTPLLFVLVIAVLFLVWRQTRLIPSAQVAVPAEQALPLPQPNQGDEAAGGKIAEHPGKDPAAPVEPAAAQAPPGVPDMEKLNRDIQAYVQGALQEAARTQKMAGEQRKDLFAKALNDKPIPPGQSRLIIDAARIPRTLHFTVEVDGVMVFRRPGDRAAPGTGANAQERRDLPFYSQVLEPGEHTLRVRAGYNRERMIASNEVSSEFEEGTQRILTVHAASGLLRRQRPGTAEGDADPRPAVRITLE